MEHESVPATERYVKPVSGYALHSHVTAAGCCWNERTEWCPRALSSLSLLLIFVGWLTTTTSATIYDAVAALSCRTVPFTSCVCSNRERRSAKRFILRHIVFVVHIIRTRKEQFCCSI